MIDWIYWIEGGQWDNALVFNDEYGHIYNQLKQYFTNVYSINVQNIHEFKKAFDSNRLKEIQFDLIFCTYLFHELTTHRKNIKIISERLFSVLSEQGNLVFGYMHGWILLGYIINRMLTNNVLKSFYEYSEINNGKPAANIFYKNLMKSRRFKPIHTLFVFPTYQEPWTISNSKLFGQRACDWKKSTRRNSAMLWFMSSRFTSWLCKYWWPHRIMIIGNEN